MPAPDTPVVLEDPCSIIYNNTLYVYTPHALQSLPLQHDAQWSLEPMGISVTGGFCVKGGVDGDNSKPALYIVGGSTNSSTTQYPGLQRYSILDKRWENISPLAAVTQNRRHHGAAFLYTSSSILVYGGSQDGDSNASTQTFVIVTYPPYGVQAFDSVAPPVVDPIMVPWSHSHAAMLGGSSKNVAVFIFDIRDGWTDSGVTLTDPLPDHTTTLCAVLSLDDGSKLLETFYMDRDPNSVTRTVLLQPGGSPAPEGENVGGSVSSIASKASSRPLIPRDRKREVLLNTFPPYNGTLAPSTTRKGFSLAQDGSGLVVMAGGSVTDPLSIFNQTANGWIDTTQFFEGSSQTVLYGGGSMTSTMASATRAIATSTHTEAATPTRQSKNHTSTILGAVLGTMLALIALLFVTLLVLRHLKKWGNHRDFERHKPQYAADKKRPKNLTSFEHPGQQPLSRAGAPMGRSLVSSMDSMAIIGGGTSHMRQDPSSMGSKAKQDMIRSSNVSFGHAMFARNRNSLPISRPIMQEQGPEVQDRTTSAVTAIPLGKVMAPTTPSATMTPAHSAMTTRPANRKIDGGWSTYFHDNNAIDLTGYQNSYTTQETESDSRGGYGPAPTGPTPPYNSTSPGSNDEGSRDPRYNTSSGSSDLKNPPEGRQGADFNTSRDVPDKVPTVDSMASAMNGEHDYDYDKIADGRSSGPSSSTDIFHTSGIRSSIPEGPYWTPVGNTWSGPPQRPFRPPSSNYGNSTFYASATGNGDSSIPSFPIFRANRPLMHWKQDDELEVTVDPGALSLEFAPQRPQRPEDVSDYFGRNPERLGTASDMSWLNLRDNR